MRKLEPCTSSAKIEHYLKTKRILKTMPITHTHTYVAIILLITLHSHVNTQAKWWSRRQQQRKAEVSRTLWRDDGATFVASFEANNNKPYNTIMTSESGKRDEKGDCFSSSSVLSITKHITKRIANAHIWIHYIFVRERKLLRERLLIAQINDIYH